MAGHAVGVAIDVAAGQPTRSTPEEQAAHWRGHSATELAAVSIFR